MYVGTTALLKTTGTMSFFMCQNFSEGTVVSGEDKDEANL